MGPLKALGAALALALAVPAAASPEDRWQPLIAEASARFGIPEEWIVRVMRAESGGRTHLGGRPITSPAGAMGLMQVMAPTYAALARAHGLGADPHDPRDNILAGTAYLRAMYDRYGYPGLFAAYNAGPGRYEQFLKRGRTLPAETRAYVARLTKGGVTAAEAAPAKALAPAPEPPDRTGGRLFYTLRTAPQEPLEAARKASSERLFVTLGGAPAARE